MASRSKNIRDREPSPYKARGAAAQLWRDRSNEVLLVGPAGTGKTRACLEKIHAALLRWPGSRALVCRKTRASLTESALVTFENKVLAPGDSLAEGPSRASRRSYDYPNGSSLVVGGMDRSTRILSTEFDLIYTPETIEFSEHEFETLTTRLRNGVMPFQQLIADTNPDAPGHWLNKRCERGACKVLQSRFEDNPELWDTRRNDWTPKGTAYIAKLDALTGARKLRLRYGLWAASEGVIYDEWDAAVHLIAPFPIPSEWRRIRSIDFGYTNPLVCQWWAIDPDGRMILYRELYQTRRLVSDHAAAIRRLSAGERYEATVADWDAEDRATLEACGISTRPAAKEVRLGIEAVQLRLRKAGDGKPRLFLMRDCLAARDAELVEAKLPTCTAEEIEGYVWAKSGDGRPAKEEPLKLNDHGLDALRYAVAHVDRLGTYSAGAF